MNDMIKREASDKTPKTLDEQRAELRIRLQLNRRLLTHKFSGDQADNHFPRSMVVRFLTQQTTIHILKKLAYTAIGMKTFKSLQYGFSLAQFVRSRFFAKKNHDLSEKTSS
jgi:hypothetical protein